MDRGAWRATVQGVTKESNTTERLNNNPEERNHSGTRGMAMQKNSEPRILQPGNSRFEKLWILDSENPRNSIGEIKQGKKKSTKIRKEEVNLSLSAEDKVSYVDTKVPHTTVRT